MSKNAVIKNTVAWDKKLSKFEINLLEVGIDELCGIRSKLRKNCLTLIKFDEIGFVFLKNA
jgi:hypothetical protein